VAYAGPNVEYFAGDFDGDGRADIASRNVRTGYMAIRRTRGAGYNMLEDLDLNAGPSASSPAWRTVVADMDGDGRADFVDVHPSSGQIWRHLNLGFSLSGPSPGFDPVGTLMGNAFVGAGWTVMFGDFDGDGRADYADLYNGGDGLGYFFMHRNTGNGFDGGYGSRIDIGGLPNWRVLGGQ
jgi:FG-GAP-like repeat